MEKLLDTQLFDLIKQYNDFGVGLHGIRNENGLHQKIAMEIFRSYLKLGGSYRSINGNVEEIGIVGRDDSSINSALHGYVWGEYQNNIIVLYPPYIENDKGEKLYLGYTESPKAGYDQDTPRSLMDIVCSSLGYIPKEFILGYYIDKEHKLGDDKLKENITYDFIRNPNFCNGYKVNNELFDLIKNSIIKEFGLINFAKACMESLEKLDMTPLENYCSNSINKIVFSDLREGLDEKIYNDVKERIERKKKLNSTFSSQRQEDALEKKIQEYLKKQTELQIEADKGNKRGTFKM